MWNMGRSFAFPGNVSGAPYWTPKTGNQLPWLLTQKEANVYNLDSFTKAFSYVSLKVPAHFGQNKISASVITQLNNIAALNNTRELL